MANSFYLAGFSVKARWQVELNYHTILKARGIHPPVHMKTAHLQLVAVKIA
jgi:hypothetical protein